MGTMQDHDPGETQEWVDSLKAVIAHVGPERARYLLGKVRDEAGSGGMPIEVGDTLHIQREPIVGQNKRVSTTYPHFVDDVSAGDRVLTRSRHL